ncbi:MAG: efflux RND transporter permease subunit [Alphaproteobacteria bacterium]|nr:efflux RND transporter permease subunit [Alphaproteobacteria bacterium]
MNISNTFIDKPILASVLSLFIFIAGLISLPLMPISEYPEVAPPSVVVRAAYPGANPKVISETVAAPLEEAINGVENMLYMSSQATTDGNVSITITFKLGSDADKAQQLVQNRISQALPRLPDVVRTIGVTTVKSSPDLTMVVHLYSPNDRYDMLYLRNYALLNVKDSLGRIEGVGQALLFGAGDYAMRVWLDPQKVAARNLNATDVVNAIREQNIQVAAGIIGGSPISKDVHFELPVNTQGRLQTVEDFGNIILKAGADGSVTTLKDVARLELGASEYALRSLLNNKAAVAIPIFQTPGSNAIQISDRVRAAMEDLKKDFPEGLDYSIVYDPTVFVRQSIEKVVHTLLEAVALVVLVVIIFLQTWRASIIPLLAVPISIIGTFAFMHLFGFSINALSLFGLVLAIGIVVDDAIVVVENVERNIEAGLTPRDAAYQAMREVSGPIVAIALVLCAVFIPIAFISGLTGQFYRQFALTITISTIISAFNSLTLSPALAALLLKGHDAPKDALTRAMDGMFGPFFNWFNKFFRKSSENYSHGVAKILGRKTITMMVYGGLIVATFILFRMVPAGYVPSQDKQYLVAFAQLPGGASLDRSEEVIREMSDIALKEPGVESSVAFPGLSIAGFSNSPNAGIVFTTLKPFDERTAPNLSGAAIAASLGQKYAGIKDAFTAIFPPPPVQGLGTIGGFKLQIEDKNDEGYDTLYNVTQEVINKARMSPLLDPWSVFSSYQINVPQLETDVNRTKVKQLGIPLTDVFNTMQVYLGSLYINDFNKFGRTFRVVAQADAPFRAHPDDILQLKVRNSNNEMVPLGALMSVKETYGPDRAMRYNAFRAADLNGGAQHGVSSGQAQAEIERILKETLPKGMSYEWTDLTYQQILAGNTALLVFPLCVMFVFLVLAAQYESVSLPLAVILIVPMCLLCAITGVWIMGKENNIFTQIGFIVLVGLSCKNSILIVEFARELEIQGKGIVEAAIEACHLRLRPILMTSFAFIMGVIPLATSTGAGAEMRRDMGVAVFSGMLGVTFFGLFLTPVFYVLIRTLATRHKKQIPAEGVRHD